MTPAAVALSRRWALIALVTALPILVLIGSLAGRTWYPTGDQAQAELRMQSLPSDVPLVGAAGRIEDAQHRQGNHPGPLMFWATWPLYEALGASAWAFEAATALVNVAWLTLAGWLVKRRAGLAASMWFAAVALVLIGGFGLDALSQPWNPWVALLPFVVLLLATWSAIEGERWAPVVAVAAASYSLQGHVGYALVALPLCLVALAAPLVRWWRGPTAERGSGEEPGEEPNGRLSVRTWAAPLAASVLVALLAWSGPLWDLATGRPSNVAKLVDNFSDPSEPPIGLARGVEAVLQASAPFGSWVWGGPAVTGPAWPGLLFQVVWVAVAGLVAQRVRLRALNRLNATLAFTLVLGTLAVSRIFGALYLYTFRWIVVIVALQVFSLGWGLALLLWPQDRPVGRPLGAAALAGLVLLSTATAVRVARQEIPYDQSWRAEAVIAPAVADRLDPDRRYLVVWDDPAYLGGLGFGLILDLERRGFTVGAGPQFAAAVEPHRVLCPGQYDAVLVVVTGVHNIAEHRSRDGYVELAYTDPREDVAAWERAHRELLDAVNRGRSPGEAEVTARDLERTLNFRLLDPDGTPEVIGLAEILVLGGVPTAVFLQDPPPDPGPLAESAITEICRDAP